MSAGTLPHASQAAQLADIAGRACKLTGGSGAAIALREGDELLTVASKGGSAPDVGVPVSLNGSFAGLCFQTGTVQVCGDTESDRRVNAEVCRALGVRSMIAMPVRHADRMRGVLAVFAPVPHAFDGSVSVLTTLADIVGEVAVRGEPTPAQAEPPARNKAERTEAAPPPPAGDFGLEKEPQPPVAASPEPPPVPVAAATAVLQMPASSLEAASTVVHDITAADLPKPAPRPRAAARRPSQPSKPRKPELLLPAEDPGPATFHPIVPTTPPAFAMLDQLQKPARHHYKHLRIALVALCGAVVIGIGGWRLHAARSNDSPALAAAAAEATPVPTTQPEPVPASTPAPPPTERVTVSAPRTPEPVHTRPAPPAKAAPEVKPPASEPRVTRDLPERKELAILIPTARPKAEPEMAAPPTVAVASNALPDLASKPYVPSVAAVRSSQLVPARLVKSVTPIYPSIAKSVKVTDKVVINAVITKEGKLTNLRVVRGMVMFQQAALEAVKQWRYEPAMLNGSPVESSVEVELKFKGKE